MRNRFIVALSRLKVSFLSLILSGLSEDAPLRKAFGIFSCLVVVGEGVVESEHKEGVTTCQLRVDIYQGFCFTAPVGARIMRG
jgi:hypothetical protein